MKNRLITALVLLCALFSCSEVELEKKDAPSTLNVENGRLVFATNEEYLNLVKNLSQMNDEELAGWSSSHNFRSSLDEVSENSLDSDIIPNSIRALLNKDYEVQIENHIVWYNKGFRHFIPTNDISKLKTIKLDPSQSKLKGEYHATPIAEEPASGRINLSIGSFDARNQKEFYYLNQGGSRRKYVHFLEAYYETAPTNFGYDVYSQLYLRLRLEWYGSSRWRLSGETRNSSVNINYSVSFRASAPYIVWPFDGSFYTGSISQSFLNYSGDNTKVLIAQRADPHYYGDPTPYWSVEITGTIYHKIVSDLQSNEWYNTGNSVTPDKLW